MANFNLTRMAFFCKKSQLFPYLKIWSLWKYHTAADSFCKLTSSLHFLGFSTLWIITWHGLHCGLLSSSPLGLSARPTRISLAASLEAAPQIKGGNLASQAPIQFWDLLWLRPSWIEWPSGEFQLGRTVLTGKFYHACLLLHCSNWPLPTVVSTSGGQSERSMVELFF